MEDLTDAIWEFLDMGFSSAAWRWFHEYSVDEPSIELDAPRSPFMENQNPMDTLTSVGSQWDVFVFSESDLS